MRYRRAPTGPQVTPKRRLNSLCAMRSILFYVEKDFPKKVSFSIMGIGILLRFFTYGISLIVCGLIDWGLYQILPDKRVCYYCSTEYRGYPPDPSLEIFDPHKGVAYDARRAHGFIIHVESLRSTLTSSSRNRPIGPGLGVIALGSGNHDAQGIA